MADPQSLLDWLRELFFDDDKRAAFEADPRQVLQQAGFDDVSPAELREGLALVGSEPNVNPALLEQTLAATTGGQQAASPAYQAATAEPPPPVPGSVGPGTVSPVGPQGGVDPLADLGIAATALAEDARRDAPIAEEAGTPEAGTTPAGDDLAGIGLLDDAGARLDDPGIGSADAQPPFAEAGGGEEPKALGGLAPDPFAFTPADPLAAEPTDPFGLEPADPFAPEPTPLDDPFGLAQADPFALEGLDDAGNIWDASDEVAGPTWDDPGDPFDDPSSF